MITSASHIRVRYAETDAMGIVHHRHFATWFELARVEMMDNLGLPYKNLESQGILMPVLEIHTKFLKPAYFDDRLTIKVSIKEPPKVKLKVEYEILRNSDLLTTGQTIHAFMNTQKQAIRPPKAFLDVVRNYF